MAALKEMTFRLELGKKIERCRKLNLIQTTSPILRIPAKRADGVERKKHRLRVCAADKQPHIRSLSNFLGLRFA